MSVTIPFDNSYARLPDAFFARLNPSPASAPSLIRFNDALAQDLGITTGDADLAAIFAGNQIPEGAEPLAQAYAGHQFGGFSPQLGDGRANLLGEVVDTHGQRRDIQLKGSGPTPYSRNGDGRAWLGPVLREYVLSEAMHALGIPTTRALAATATGDMIYREAGALPGAVLTRVAASHIRVGTFQYFLARRDLTHLRQLYDYTRQRHYPQAQTPGDLLRAVVDRQARLVTDWMAVGFIHGVMNTDNTSLSGETIDYGPCAYLDRFAADKVFSSIDAQGRYSYANQAHVIVWNMAQLATCLVPLTADQDAAVEEYTAIIHAMPDLIERHWLAAFGRKIGLDDAGEDDRPLIEDLLGLMENDGADFTNTFRALGTDSARDQFIDRAAFDAWETRWQARIADVPGAQDADAQGAHDLMARSNPWIIPRNHRIEGMIAAAVAGDFAPFDRMLRALARPYAEQDEHRDLIQPPQKHERVLRTFCGT